MKKSIVSLFVLFLLLPFSSLAGEWEELYTEAEVKVSKMDIEGSKFVAFKGDTIMNAPIRRVLYVLMDNDHRKDWVDMLYVNTILERNGKHEYVLYQAFDLPAMFQSRDYVYRGKVTMDDSGVVLLKMASIEHDKSPETVGVRAEIVNSLYRLTSTADGKTRVEVEIQTDPKGWMPAWLVNFVQRSWPLETLNGLRGQLDKPFTGEYPLPGEAEASTSAPADASPVDEAQGSADEVGQTSDDAEPTSDDGNEPTPADDAAEGGESPDAAAE